MKKVYIIHGWGGSPEEPLLKWLSAELKKEGLEVEVPVMPNPDAPKIEEWVNKLNDVAGRIPDKDTIFVGHSVGCQTILRYLEGVDAFGFVGGVVLIAPWFYLSGLETQEEKDIAEPWIETEIKNPKVLKHIPPNKLVAIFSDNDPHVPVENADLFKNRFGARIIKESKKGHFTADDGVNNLSSALNAILEMR